MSVKLSTALLCRIVDMAETTNEINGISFHDFIFERIPSPCIQIYCQHSMKYTQSKDYQNLAVTQLISHIVWYILL